MGRFHPHRDGADHHHDDGHQHGPGDHDHDHGHAHDPGHDHNHLPDHNHGHQHGPGDHDHDHGLAHDPGHDHDHLPDHDYDPGHGTAVSARVGDHTAYRRGPQRVAVLEGILAENDAAAAANRTALEAAGVCCVNVMSAPGAGKTTLLARTLEHLRDNGIRTGVVVGDIETAIDADRLRVTGAPISLVNTGSGFGGECHLDAPMVARGLRGLPLSELDLVLVENVGNLVCPAEFDVGAHRRVMVSAVTEGEDKPLKYPVMFRAVELVLVNKIDLLPHLDYDLAAFEANVTAVNPQARILRVSARRGTGLPDWFQWLDAARRDHGAAAAPGPTRNPAPRHE